MSRKRQPHYRIQLKWFRPLFWPLLLPIALLLALFNKLSPVPFKIYLMRVDRIGHLAENTEQFCCKLDLGQIGREFRVFVHRDAPCNRFLLRMWSRVLPIRQVFLPLFDVCNKLGGLGVVSKTLQTIGPNLQNEVEQCRRHLRFTPEEEAEAREQCRALGFDSDDPFVCVLGRDDAYLLQHNPHEDNSHYKYRNVDINTYIPALEHLAEQFTVIRMGNVALDRLRTDNPRIIDYPFSGQCSELLDVFLAARCRFFITCGSGLDSIASICFRLPVLYVNFLPPRLIVNFGSRNMTILKHYWSVAEKRFLALSEILASGVGESYDYYRIKEFGVEIVDNSPEELLEAVREMEERVDGTWAESPQDAALQQAFWECYRPHYPDRVYVAHIGANFLRRNPHWAR